MPLHRWQLLTDCGNEHGFHLGVVRRCLINLDFADVRTIMSGMGIAMMGTGTGRGQNRALDAAQKAIASPLLDDSSIAGARGVLMNFTGGPNLSIHEGEEATRIAQEAAHVEPNSASRRIDRAAGRRACPSNGYD